MASRVLVVATFSCLAGMVFADLSAYTYVLVLPGYIGVSALYACVCMCVFVYCTGASMDLQHKDLTVLL
jgi:hypothetical protein